MRKILIGVLIILLVIVAGMTIFKGLIIGNFQILSASQIVEENEKLTDEIAATELLMYSTFRSKTDELESNVSDLIDAKKEYLDLESVSTELELAKANTKETYTVEFLWTRLGRHATAKGVNLECVLSSNNTTGMRTINFTAIGEYTAIIEFISAIEDDDKLGFRIENFKMIPEGERVRTTFTTRNVNVKIEKVTNSTQDNEIDNEDNTTQE